MTQEESNLCSLLLREHFGEVVDRVGTHLIRTGAQPLRMIAHDTGTPLDLVKKALCVLIQHSLAWFRVSRRGQVEYEADCTRVLRLQRYPRYIYTAKTLYGDTGELAVEELLQHGKMSMSDVMRRVADRLTDSMEEGKSMEHSEVANTFTKLVETHFLQRCPLPALDDGIYWQGNLERFHQHFRDQAIIAAVASKMDQTSSEIVRTMLRMSEVTTTPGAAHTQPLSSNEPALDDGIYWQVNLERFHQHFRDQAIIAAVASKMDQTSSEIVRTMLRMSEVTTTPGAAHTQPLSSNEIFRALPAGYSISKPVLDQYLSLLADDPIFRTLPAGYSISKPVLDQYLSLLADDPMEFVGKLGDSGGGMFVITSLSDLHKALACLAKAALESVVQERFGSRSARIFRLLLRKRHLEQKQVEDFAMIPAKEAKDMLYTMLSENLVSLQPGIAVIDMLSENQVSLQRTLPAPRPSELRADTRRAYPPGGGHALTSALELLGVEEEAGSRSWDRRTLAEPSEQL
ncbi:UNVERIFIED_CONTAM: hypothetical protein FKN15_015986 [Acipenser sinensis]